MKTQKIATTAILAIMALSMLASIDPFARTDKGETLFPVTPTNSGARLIDENFDTYADGDPIDGAPWDTTGEHATDCWFNASDVGGNMMGYYNDSYDSGKLQATFTSDMKANASGSWVEIRIRMNESTSGDLSVMFEESATDTAFVVAEFQDDNTIDVYGASGGLTSYWVLGTFVTIRVTVIDDAECMLSINGSLSEVDESSGPNFFVDGMDQVTIWTSNDDYEVEATVEYIDMGVTRAGAIDEDFEGYAPDATWIGQTLGEESNNTFGQGYWIRGGSYPFEVVDDGRNNVGYIDDYGAGSFICDYYNGTGTVGAGTMVEAINTTGDYFAVKITSITGNTGASLSLRLSDDVNGLGAILKFNELQNTLQMTDENTSHFHDVLQYTHREEYEIRIVIFNDTAFDLWIEGEIFDNSGEHYVVESGMTTHVANVQFKTADTPRSSYYVDDLDFSTTGDRTTASWMNTVIDSNSHFAILAERGNGTAANPWVISDLSFDAAGNFYALRIMSTTDHVLFKSLWAANASTGAIGLQGCENVDLEYIYTVDSDMHVMFVSTINCSLTNFYAVDSDGGDATAMGAIYVDTAADTMIEDVMITGGVDIGITVADDLGAGIVKNISITDVVISGAGNSPSYGILFRTVTVEDVSFENIEISGVETGIFFNDLTCGQNSMDLSHIYVYNVSDGIVVDTASNVEFSDSLFEISHLGGHIVEAVSGSIVNFTFFLTEFCSVSGSEDLQFTSTVNTTFYGCSFYYYHRADPIFIFDSDVNTTFYVCDFDSGLNASTFFATGSTNLTVLACVYADYFEVFPYANATDMTMTTLNETYSVAGAFNDTIPYYFGYYYFFLRNETVDLTFVDENGSPVAFADLVVDVLGTTVGSASVAVDAVLYDVIVYHDGDCVSMQVYNLNSTGNALTIALNFTGSPDHPTAHFTVSGTLRAGRTVTFTSDGIAGTTPMTYTWNFGDGRGAVGTVVTHVFTNGGSFLVILLATDGDGDVSYSTLNILVASNPGSGGDGDGDGDGDGGEEDAGTPILGTVETVAIVVSSVVAIGAISGAAFLGRQPVNKGVRRSTTSRSTSPSRSTKNKPSRKR